jgi:glycosyltransferase involved in cell wall biosynthesis
MLARLDGLICLTRGVYDALQDIFGLSLSLPTLILPSGTALPARNLPDDTERDLDIVYAGKIIRRKGVYDLVEALQYLPGYRLCILGGAKGQLKELIAFAAERGVMSQITFTGHVEPATVCEYWMRAKVGVCPLPLGESDISERYTSPLKVLEMMAYGVPIVATSVPTLADLLKPGETAQFARPSDPHSLAEAIRMLLENRVLARQLAANAHLEVKAYSWDQRARRLHEFLLHQELFNHSMSSEAPKRTV